MQVCKVDMCAVRTRLTLARARDRFCWLSELEVLLNMLLRGVAQSSCYVCPAACPPPPSPASQSSYIAHPSCPSPYSLHPLVMATDPAYARSPHFCAYPLLLMPWYPNPIEHLGGGCNNPFVSYVCSTAGWATLGHAYLQHGLCRSHMLHNYVAAHPSSSRLGQSADRMLYGGMLLQDWYDCICRPSKLLPRPHCIALILQAHAPQHPLHNPHPPPPSSMPTALLPHPCLPCFLLLLLLPGHPGHFSM